MVERKRERDDEEVQDSTFFRSSVLDPPSRSLDPLEELKEDVGEMWLPNVTEYVPKEVD